MVDKASANIENVSVITNVTPHNKHTRASVVAIANALEANARAAEALASALKGAQINSTGIHLHDIGGPA